VWAVADPKSRRSFRLGAQQPVVRLEVDGAGEARWWHADLGGGHTAGSRMLGIGAGERTAPPVEGSPLAWVLHDPTRRLITAENRYGLRVAGMAVERVPAREYEPTPHRLQPWSR
jgi:hypothetical protein